MSITFKVRDHRGNNSRQVVDVLLDDRVVATVYPDSSGTSIKVVSPHIIDTQIDIDDAADGSLAEVEIGDGVGSKPPYPWVRIIFQLTAFKIEHGELVRLN
jgi:hypothetical protein